MSFECFFMTVESPLTVESRGTVESLTTVESGMTVESRTTVESLGRGSGAPRPKLKPMDRSRKRVMMLAKMANHNKIL
jgi:hypothetical protein